VRDEGEGSSFEGEFQGRIVGAESSRKRRISGANAKE
jgi:hypothetical protein